MTYIREQTFFREYIPIILIAVLVAVTGFWYIAFYNPQLAYADISSVTASGTTAGTASGVNVTIASPTGTATGDVLVLAISTRSTTETVTSVDNGSGGNSFTKLTFFSTGNNTSLSIWYRVVQAGDPSSWTITNTGNIEAGLIAYRGVDNGTPIDAQGTGNSGAGATVTMNAVTTVTAKAWYVGIAGSNSAADGNVTSTTLTNIRANAGDGGGNTTKQSVFIGDSIITSPGSSGTFTATGTLVLGSTFAFALRPAIVSTSYVPPPGINVRGGVKIRSGVQIR